VRDLKLEFMPVATQKNFARLKNDHRLAGFTLVGGTALAIQIGHRVSEDLDFNIFGQKLPVGNIDSILDELVSEGVAIESLITPEQKLGFKINTSENLDHYIQDYLIDGAKVTFHSRNAGDRPQRQIDFLKSSPKLEIGKGCFDVLGLDGLLAMKSIVVYDRIRSRDIFDLMILTRDHGYTLKDIFVYIDTCQPIRHKDPEHFKSVVTGLIPVDQNDEGFSSIHLNVKLDELYKHFKKLINDDEVKAVQKIRAGFAADRLTKPPPL